MSAKGKKYTVNKEEYASKMSTQAFAFIAQYYIFIFFFLFFVVVLRATDLNNEYLTQNVLLKPLYQFLRETQLFQTHFYDVSIETFYKSILLFIYTILLVYLMSDMMKANMYQNLYGTIQFQKENNPTKNPTLLSKIQDDPSQDTYTYLWKLYSTLFFVLLYPMIVLYAIRCYDVQNNLITQVAVASILFVPLFYYLTSHLVSMKAVYKTDDLLNYGKKYVEEKDYVYIDLLRNDFNFHLDKILWIPLLLIFVTLFYFMIYYEWKWENRQMKFYLLLLFILIPLILLFFQYSILFGCYTPNNECGILRNGKIKYEVYHEGVRSLYDAFVKYNYLCFPK